MVSKLSRLRAAYAAGDGVGALRIAAKFPSLGAEAPAITRAWNAHTNPDFYRQIGQDPASLIAAGLDALRAKYKL